MRYEHISDGWWTMPGAPVAALGWPGTKNGRGHMVWLPKAGQGLLGGGKSTGFVFGTPRPLDPVMRDICSKLGAARATPHDLRRTWGTTCAGLGLGREAMDRVMNHKEASVGDVYDRADYGPQMKQVMETSRRPNSLPWPW